MLTIDSPPVNQMSPQLSSDLAQALTEGLSYPDVKALILTGTGKNFVAGADITELQSLKNRREAFRLAQTASSLFNMIETGSKPVIAAINGNCLGGGLELAMACHYRVAAKAASLGLPEVQIGVIPGAGGIQRLPRLIGLPYALELITTGRSLPAEKALSMGLVDESVDSDELMEAALKAAQRFIAGEMDRKTLMTKSRKDLLPSGEAKRALIEDFKARNAKKFKGTIAPFSAMEAMEKGLSDDIQTDIQRDVELFGECAISDVARNLIGVFLNSRSAGKLPRIKGLEPARIENVAMLGGGVMGSGIVHLLLINGFDVVLWDINQDAIQKALATIRKTFAFSIKQKKMTDQDLEKLIDEHLTTTCSLEDLKDADLVIEAVLEDMSIKQEIWRKLESICRPNTVFGTNTSALPITEMASVLRDLGRMIGLHFFNPAERMQLLEIICGNDTSSQTLATSVAFARAIKKTIIVVNDAPGFYVSRQLIGLFAAMPYLVADGVDLAVVEQAMVEFGMPMGPAFLEDLTGIDIGYHVGKTFEQRLGERYKVHPLIERIYQIGCYGRKTGAGYFDYTGEKPVPNEKVLAVVRLYLEENAVSPKKMTHQEIIDTMLALGINEAALMIEEGVCSRPQDMDLAMIYGAGFPAYRGGILRYADKWGISNVYAKLVELEDRYGLRFRPARVLREMADAGRTFYEA
ncbi:MAG: 3-hydroxyacyl-CoA dehydrogenase NAD-binding domain-containing protein [Thermodesulfobacteriota bacterium]